MQIEREAFELCAQQAVLIGLQQCRAEELSGTADDRNVNNIYSFTRATISLNPYTQRHTDTTHNTQHTCTNGHRHMHTDTHADIQIYTDTH